MEKPPAPIDEYYDYETSGIRRNSNEDYYEDTEYEDNANWKSPADLARDFMGSLAYASQAIFAPWTLPGQPFGVDGNGAKTER